MDGTYLTTLRTGAATGVSVKYLARKNCEFLSIFGAGAQSQAQVEGVYWALNQNLKRCTVYDPNQTSMGYFKKSVEHRLGIEVKISENPQKLIEALQQAWWKKFALVPACVELSQGWKSLRLRSVIGL